MTASPLDDDSAVIAREAGQEMLSRLNWMTLMPAMVLVTDNGANGWTEALKQRYPQAVILSDGAVTLTLRNQSVDLIFANLRLPWLADAQALLAMLQEWRRVLTPNGLLIFTAFGRDTLQEFKGECNPLFLDMHDYGDMLVKAGFSDPVLDVDYYTLSYRDPQKLWRELQETNMLNVMPFNADALSRLPDGCYELTYEVIQAHAFAPMHGAVFAPDEDGVTRIPLAHLRRGF